MTDSIRPCLLWTIAISGIAGLLATISTRFAALPWLAHFGFALFALIIMSCLARCLSRGKATRQARVACPAAASGDELPAAFLSVAGHEMKTPLAGIKAYVELLADGDADDDAIRAEFLDGIVSQVERLERVIEGLLAMTRDNDFSRAARQDAIAELAAVDGEPKPSNR
jgi:signal transduction histidine kinase